MSETLKLTYQMMQSQRSPKGGWTKRQLAAVGVEWPPRKGWMDELAGSEITHDQWDEFCRRPYE